MSPKRRLKRDVERERDRDRGKSKVNPNKRQRVEGKKGVISKDESESSGSEADFVYKARSKRSYYEEFSDEESYSEGNGSDNSVEREDSPLLKRKHKQKEARIPTGKFVLGSQMVSVSSRDVQLIFGVGGGDVRIPLRSGDYEIVPWVKRCFKKQIDKTKGNLVLYKRMIYSSLCSAVEREDATSIMDVARLTHIYLLACVLAPNKNATVSPHIAAYMENLTNVCNYDWCTYIVDLLLSQVKKSNTRSGGCIMLLPFWFCEHSTLIRPVTEVAFPRFLKWDLNELERKLKSVKISDMNNQLVRTLKLKSTLREQEQLQKLMMFWDKTNEHCNTSSDDVLHSTMGISSEETDSMYPTADSPQKFDESDEDLNATINIATREDMGLGKVSRQCKLLMSENDPSTSKHGSNSRHIRRDFSMHSDDNRGLECSENIRPGCKISGKDDTDISNQIDAPHSVGDDRCVEEAQTEHMGNLPNVDTAVGFAVEYGMHAENLKLIQLKLDDSTKVVSELQKQIESLKSDFEKKEKAIEDKMKAEFEGETKKKVDEAVLSEKALYEKEVQVKDSLISTLRKEVLEVMTASLHAEGKYAKLLRDKDDLIRILRNEIARLTDRVKALSIPTLTQICSDPINISHIDAVEKLYISNMEKEQLRKEKANLLDTIETNNIIDEYCVLTVGEKTDVKNKGKKPFPEPNSMAMRVKARSRREERKAIEVTPQLNTREIIEVHEDEDRRNEKKKREPKKNLQFNGKLEAVRKTKDKIKDVVAGYFENNSPGYVVWDGLCVFSYVTVRDIISIIHHERISEADLIHTRKPLQILNSLVDDKLETIGQFDVLIFPLLVKTFEGATRKMGDHWTILILDLGSCEWSFYNSMRPRRGESNDNHLVGAKIVVEHVETKLRKIFKEKYGCHRLLTTGPKKPESVACLQQHPDSVDCGVIVCEHIENTLLRNPKKTGVYTKSRAGEYRAKMVEWFVDPANMKHPSLTY
ncbi:hypothetical protein ACS0TY_012545 [Phlomoides rotata]